MAEAPALPTPAAGRSRPWAVPLALALVLRLVFSGWAYFISSQFEVTVPAPETFRFADSRWAEPFDRLILEPWRRWDTEWYLKISQEGYGREDASAAFYPLYPLLMHALGALLASPLAAALLISTAATAISFTLLQEVTRLELDEASARRALPLLAVFPTAFFLLAGYTEALFLAFALGAVLSARRGRWWLAGLCGGLAALTRPSGYLLLLPLGVEFWRQRRDGKAPLQRAATLLLVPLGMALYALYLGIRLGDPLLPLRAAAYWRMWVPPWQPFVLMFQQLGSGTVAGSGRNAIDLGVTVVFGALLWRARRSLPPIYPTYMAAIFFFPLFTLPLLNGKLVPFPLQSISRYLLVAFPAFMVLGHDLRRPIWFRVVLYTSFFLELLLAALFALWFPIL